MLVYLSKKINIPNGVKLNCISWNREQGWIACGGESGLLKVLKLETPTGPDAKLQGIAASSNLSMNQTLEGHTGAVVCVTWNPQFKKLTTSDETGLIIVWMLHKGMWYEEMINNRNKSVVRDMKWTSDGRKIAIVYEDGAVIVGSVDGNRLWGKELNMPLRFVEWSPDSRWIIFVTLDAEVWIYDAEGNKIRSFTLVGQDNSGLGGEVGITGIHWFSSGTNHSKHSSVSSNNLGVELPGTLSIAFDNGKIQLSHGDEDNTSEIIDSGLASISYCRWTTKGNILAVVGALSTATQSTGQGSKSDSPTKNSNGSSIVKFFDAYGKYIRNIRIPGENISAVSWEGGDLRLALAVDSFIYFANIRHTYMWTYFLNTVVYSYPKSERREHVVVFWDLVSLEAHSKNVNNLKFLVASGDLCALVVSERVPITSSTSSSSSSANIKKNNKDAKGGNDDSDEEVNTKNKKNSTDKSTTGFTEIYTIQLRNSIGAVTDTKILPFAPKYVAMSAYHVVATNDRTVYSWQFQSQVARSGLANASTAALLNSGTANKATGDDNDNEETGMSGGKTANTSSNNNNTTKSHHSKARMFDIAHTSFTTAQSPETFQIISETIANPITCATISDRFLVLGRKNGTITRFNLPHLTPENSYTVADREPYLMTLNCTSTKIGFVDNNGIFSILDLEVRITENTNEESKGENSRYSLGPYYGKRLNIERKDVWDMRWSEDDADMLVIMEKTKMIVFNGEVAEEPVVSSAYLARFKDLEIRVVTMDTLIQHPEKTPSKECVIDFESKSLREVRDVINSDGLPAGYSYAESNSHPRLWKLLACSALEALELTIAEKAFVRCSDYYGIQLVKQLQNMSDKMKAKAEAAVYLNKFDVAENIFREIDRKDLAIQLRKRLGDYNGVAKLLQTGGGDDSLMRDVADKIGEYYADRLNWKKAAEYFKSSHNFERLSECYYRLDNFIELSKLCENISDDAPLLIILAKRFETVGMHKEAVDCYIRSTRPKKDAIDCCVALNKWDLALDLGERYEFNQVEGLLVKFYNNLLQNDRKLQAIELLRVANRPTDAALLIGGLADTIATKDVNPALAKKLHVLSALEIERHRKRAIDKAATATTTDGGNIAQTTAATLDTLMMTALDGNIGAGNTTLGGTLAATLGTLTANGTIHGGNTAKKIAKSFQNAWRGAAAYHYYMLSLKQLYDGTLDAAMKTAIKLCEYDDILNPRNIYSLLCLTAWKNKYFNICSKAFVKLETLVSISEEDRDAIQTLAVQIFINNKPEDPEELPEAYIKCLEVGRSYSACVITGSALQDSSSHLCKTCRHPMLERELPRWKHCPLCHSVLIISHSITNNNKH